MRSRRVPSTCDARNLVGRRDGREKGCRAAGLVSRIFGVDGLGVVWAKELRCSRYLQSYLTTAVGGGHGGAARVPDGEVQGGWGAKSQRSWEPVVRCHSMPKPT